MDLGLVLFDFHAPAPAIALLTARQVVVDLFYIDRHPCRKAFNDSRQAGTMRFTGGKETEHGTSEPLTLQSITDLRSPTAPLRFLLSFSKEASYRGEALATSAEPRSYIRPATPPTPPPFSTITVDRDARRLEAGKRSVPHFHHPSTFHHKACRPPAAKPPSVPAYPT